MANGAPGRPTKYNEGCDERAFGYSLLGATDEEMARLFDISVDTFYEWRKTRPSFSEAIKAGKEEADAKVTQALYKRALGYSQKAEKPLAVSLGAGMGSEVQIAEFTEHIAPDSTAMIFWLKNRQPKKWRNNPEAEDQNKQVIEKLDEVLDKIDGAI